MVKGAHSLHVVEDTPKHRLFPPALRMAEAGKKRFAVQDHGGICCENEISEIGSGLDQFYFGAAFQKCFVEHVPLATRLTGQ